VVRRELVDRVERQELQARHPVEEVVAEFGADALHHPVGEGVAVADGVADEPPGGVQEPVVYGPRVHADRDQAGRGAAQAVEDVAVEAENVPVQGAGDPDGTVGEAAQLHQLHGAGPQVAGHDAPAGRPQVDGREGRFAHRTTSTSSVRGPCTPSTRDSSMSLVADGPDTKVSGRRGSSRSRASVTSGATCPARTTIRW